MLEGFSHLLLIMVLQTTGHGHDLPFPTLKQEGTTTPFPASEWTKGGTSRYTLTDLTVLENAFSQQTSNLQILVLGRVIRVLSDDTTGDRHQRFIVELSNGQTLLVAHNIDIAPRLDGLQVGEELYVYGEYDWNAEGGVLHWTHHDPSGGHTDGWIEWRGVVFR